MTNKTNQVELNIVKTVFPYWLGLVAVFSIGFFMAYGWQGTYSVILGSIFSLLGLRQLSEDQYAILVQRKRKKFSSVFCSDWPFIPSQLSRH